MVRCQRCCHTSPRSGVLYCQLPDLGSICRRLSIQETARNSPGHWTRDLLRLPPIAAELPEEFEQSFLIGKPWFFGEHEFLTEQCILS